MPNYKKAIRRAARRYGVDPGILTAQIRAESGFNPNARSPAGAQGIAQFMPATARQYGVNLNDGRAGDDIDGAARYMRDNLKRTGGNYHQALSIYNSGRPDGYKHIPETRAYVQKILSQAGSGSKGRRPARGGSAPTFSPRSTFTQPAYGTEKVPGVDRSAERTQAKLAYLDDRHNPDALLNLGLSLRDMQDTPSSTRRIRLPDSSVTTGGERIGGGRRPSATATGGALVQAVKAEADAIDKAHVPYQWGGGHAGKQPRGSKITPLDCSGAVSRVLGVNPRVSGQFEKWGKPGKGRITVYANSKHVLLEVDGHFWGTSATNPGGGPGWIPRKALPPSYLRQFTARHA